MEQNFKKVLMIAFIYPPLGGSGVQRTLKFSKYLPQFGWLPYIVCSDNPQVFHDGLDPSLLNEIPPEVKIWRRAFISPLSFRNKVQKLLKIKRLKQETVDNGVESNEKRSKKFFDRLFKVLAGILAPFEFPAVDAALYWALAIVPGCLRLIRKEKIDLIYSTSFPYSDHITGYLLKKLTGLPWVADFRDPWTQNAIARNTGWRYKVDHWLEKRILYCADRVIGVTPTYTKDLRKLALKRSEEYFVTIENGYDQADFLNSSCSKMEKEQDGNPLILAHVGLLYDGTALPFFQALEALGDKAARLEVHFIGGLAPQEQNWLDWHPLAVKIKIEKRKPHAQAIEMMRQSDILLLFVIAGSPESGHYPGKLFEYMASGTPIILIGPKGDAARLLQESGTGFFISNENKQVIEDFLRRLIADFSKVRNEIYQPRLEVIQNFERRNLTKKITDVFSDVVIEHVNRS